MASAEGPAPRPQPESRGTRIGRGQVTPRRLPREQLVATWIRPSGPVAPRRSGRGLVSRRRHPDDDRVSIRSTSTASTTRCQVCILCNSIDKLSKRASRSTPPRRRRRSRPPPPPPSPRPLDHHDHSTTTTTTSTTTTMFTMSPTPIACATTSSCWGYAAWNSDVQSIAALGSAALAARRFTLESSHNYRESRHFRGSVSENVGAGS